MAWYHPPMLLTAEARQLVAAQLDLSRDQLVGLIRPLTAKQWTHQASGGNWSIAEVAAHIVEIERYTLERIEQALAEDPYSEAKQAEIAGRERRLLRHVLNRETKVKAPERYQSPVFQATPEAAIAEFLALRAQTVAMLDRPYLDRHGFAHFIFGELSCYQWLLMIGLHGSRHCLQIEETMSDISFPQN